MSEMNDIAIQVRNLGKQYRVGQYVGYRTLRESLVNVFSAPFRRYRREGEGENEANYTWALKDVTFDVKQGEVIGIIGRNGAGKTTLLRVLTRITDPTSGSAEIYGRVGSLLEIGSGFHPELTGRENIFLNGAVLGMRKAEIQRKFVEIVEFSGVEKFIDTPLKRYSSGMQVRLAFSVAAHLEPEILLVDEVLAVGDIAFQKKCLGKMQDVSQQGRTVLFVSHNMQAVRSLCPRSILLKEGSVVVDGPTNDTIMGYYNDLGLLAVDADASIRTPDRRRGSGAVRFTKINIQDESGKECSSFAMGSTIRLVLSYQVFETVNSLHVVITLRSGKSGELVTNIRHAISEEKIPPGHTGSVTIELPQVNLRPGDYPLYFWLGDRAIHENYDIVDELTPPLIVSTDKDLETLGFNPQQNSGFFNIESRIVQQSRK
jgi:lipopolysaccharide transport system ATP-binding protein